MTRIRAAVLLAVLSAAACSGGDARPGRAPGSNDDAECVDRDGDGYGAGCSRGADCDDRNAEATTECLRCAEPNTGCDCTLGTQPITCYLDKTEGDDGAVMCNEGTRYCRDSRWSACENVHTYPLPERPESTALIPDGGPVQCNDCSVNCFRVSDNLDPIDGGLNDNNSTHTSFVPGGGLTLAQIPLDASVPDPPTTNVECMPGTAPDIDCDGIPDTYDPFPTMPPFATANPGLFLDIGPGETGTGIIDLDFFINSADVYFLVDQSASMTEERDRLKADLVSGDFINNSNYNCADVNLNHIADDNGLKSQGIVGAINCIIRNANFGVGFHREIPFTNYADNQQIAFDSYQDVTSNVSNVLTAINKLNTIGNQDWPEASMIALNSVVTGNGQYFGTTKRGIPPRTDCPAGTWGYPCFRDKAIPIVILFTDAMMHNGPSNNNYPYQASSLGITRGTDMQYFPVSTTNETFSNASNVGDMTSIVKTFTGDSTGMASNIDKSTLSCLTQEGGADAFFRFDLTQTRTVRISTEGTRYDTVLGLYAGQPTTPVVLPASTNTNETADTAQNLGNVTGGSIRISGNTSAMASNYSWSPIQCNADPAARDAVYSFSVTSPTNVEVSTNGSAFDTVIALSNGQPPLAPTYTASANTNEALESATVLGDAYNNVIAYSGSTTGRTSNYLGAEVGCGADNTSPDVAYKFTLTQPTRVRLSTEGSAYDTVIALVGDTCGGSSSTPPPSTSTNSSTAVSGAAHTFLSGSLVIPMDTSTQSAALLKAYGLVYALLKADIPVSWVIKKSKSSGEADFTASANNYATGVSVGTINYRGGPFVVDSTDAARAASTISTYLMANSSVIIHRTTSSFDGYVRRQLTGAPRFALLRDTGEATARAYLAAANITDSQGTAFPDTAADVKLVSQLAGPTNTAYDGELFDSNGTPQFCGLISAGWTPAGSATATGAETVRETRQFLRSATSLFAQGSSAIAFESHATNGKFLTRNGYNPVPTPSGLFELNIDSPFAQIDGSLTGSGGSYGAFGLPQLDEFKDNDAVIYGKSGGSSGEADLWVTARLDGECSILNDTCTTGQPRGLISYLGGNPYMPATQINAVRLFLNSLFATDCVTKEQQPLPTVSIIGSSATTSSSNTYTLSYKNDGAGVAHAARLEYTVPINATYVSSTGGGTLSAGVVSWSIGSLDPGESGSVTVTVTYPTFGSYANQAAVRYSQGNTARTASSWIVTVSYTASADLQCTALGVNQSTVPSTNETQATAYDIPEVQGRIYRLAGSTGGMAANYTTNETGPTCGAASGSPDAVYKFHLSQAANVTMSTEGTTAFDTVLSLYNGPMQPFTTTTVTNSNETTAAPVALGGVNGKRIYTSGATTGSMTADYILDEVGCTNEATAPDAAYSFTLSSPTTVKISTAGTTWDTVLSLHSASIIAPPIPITVASANTNDWFNLPQVFSQSVNGRDQVITGYTGNLTGQHYLPSSCFAVSGYSTTAADAIFQFTVGASGNYKIDTADSDFDTIVAIYDSTPQFTNSNTFDLGENDNYLASRFPAGSVTSSVVQLRGDTNDNQGNQWNGGQCGTANGARDAFVAFSVTGGSNRTITLSTAGSNFDSTLQLYRYTDAAQTTYAYVDCDDDGGSNSTSLLTKTLVPGNYFVVISGDDSGDDGTYYLRISDSTTSSDVIACNDDPTTGGGTKARLDSVALTANTTYYAVVKGFSGSGNYKLRIRDNSLPTTSTPNRMDCNDDIGSTVQSELTAALNAGTYYVVVKGGAVGAKGPYSLQIEDTLNPPVATVLQCDDNSGGSGTSKIQRSLAAGDYWLALKGKTAGAAGAYTLRIADDSAAVGTILECDDDSGVDGSSVIERDLTPGTYYVIVKGDNAGEAGSYKLSVRDVTNKKLNLVQCDDDSAPANTSRIVRDLTPGTYYVTIKGDAATDAGAYSLTVQDTANSPLGALACDDDSGTYKTSVISRSLNAGTYYVAVKGYNPTAQGDYQLTIGGGTTTSSYYVPPTWSQTLSALTARGVKVLPILSCMDDPDHGNAQGDCNSLRTQAISLANNTTTFGSNNQPLYFDISRNGTGLSKNVVDGIASLAKYLEMDVRVIVKFDPDANPGFLVTVTAVDEIGDGCSGIVGAEHQNCAPGATPRFNIEITNPLPGVPKHPTDPNGGYTFRAQLIGDNQFVVEEVPIYIIPESLDTMGPAEPPVYAEGTYWQDTTSPGCVDQNQTPDWADLSWVADVYRNTTIEFIACTATTEATLSSCTPVEVAEITGAGDCTTDADCPVGYCDTDIGVCQITLGGACTLDAECADNAYCDEMGSRRCTYQSQPVYVGEALRNRNFQRYIRMQINMRVTEPFDDPPVLHSWELTYFCTNNL